MMDEPGFLVDGRLPVPDDIDQLARRDPVVHVWLAKYHRGDCCWEECLMSLVLCLAEQKKHILDEYTKLYWQSPPSFIMPVK